MILPIALLILAFAVLVIAHEFGHFIVAKRNGIHVHEFGIGFPPKLKGWRYRGTEYTINLLPLGGFVRLEGENNESQTKDSFATKSFLVKTKVLFAGVAMNLAIAYVLFVFLCITGFANTLPFDLPTWGPIRPVAAESSRLAAITIGPDSAAHTAGMETGDEIVSLNGTHPDTEPQLRELTSSLAGQTVTLSYRHEGKIIDKTVTLGNDTTKGILGVSALSQTRQRYTWWASPVAGALLIGKTIAVSVPLLWNGIAELVTQRHVPETLVGPVGVAAVAPTIVRFGWDYFIMLIASISLSLAIFNALPIPALDGGRWFFIALRKLGLPIKDHQENWVHTVAFVLLLALGIIINVANLSLFR